MIASYVDSIAYQSTPRTENPLSGINTNSVSSSQLPPPSAERMSIPEVRMDSVVSTIAPTADNAMEIEEKKE